MTGLGVKADLFYVIYQYLRHKGITHADISQEFLLTLFQRFRGYTISRRSLNYALQELENDGYIKRKRQIMPIKKGMIAQLPSNYCLGPAGIEYTSSIYKIERDRSAKYCTSVRGNNGKDIKGFKSGFALDESARSCTQNKDMYMNKKKGPLSTLEEKKKRLHEIESILSGNTTSRGDLYSLLEEKAEIQNSLLIEHQETGTA